MPRVAQSGVLMIESLSSRPGDFERYSLQLDMEMHRVKWDGAPMDDDGNPPLPESLPVRLFEYLPPPIPVTSELRVMADRCLKGGSFSGDEYGPLQAAAFLMPKTSESHKKRREGFQLQVLEARSAGFVVPDIFCKLVEIDEYIDRLHHNTIWVALPEELVAFPADPSRLVFLAFIEGHCGCGWHLLLEPSGTHCMVYCDDAFGLPSSWPTPPDYSKFELKICADSIEEWLYYYFLDSTKDNQMYLKKLEDYKGG